MTGDLGEFVILLGAALLCVVVFRRIGLGAVLGYLVAGAIVGPSGFGLVGNGEQKLEFAELGIALLLFLVGMELNPARLWRMKHDIFGFGFAQVAACTLALFAFILAVMGFTWQAVLALALPLSLSSTAQVLPSLKGSGRINTPFGERAFSILLFQDLSIVPLITIIAALSRAPADPAAPPGWMLAVYSVVAIVGLIFAGRFLLHPMLRIIGRIGERELFVVVGLFAVLASAGLMHSLHLSTALGAFVAGVMLADSPYRHELEADVEPFRSILLGLFFLAVGMVLDISIVVERPLLIIALAAGLVAIKAGAIWAIARLFGMAWRPALALALLLSQGGEFGFVLFAQAQDALLIAPDAASLFGAVVTLSMATTPFLMIFARWLEGHAQDDAASNQLDGPEHAPSGQAIIVGYGRVGQIVAQMLHAADCSVTLIDRKPSQIELSGRFAVKVYYGDGLRLDVLRHAGADSAQLIVICTDDRSLSAEHLTKICAAFPYAQVVARAFDRRQLMDFANAPLLGTVREVFESSVSMGLISLEAINVAAEEIGDIERAVRQLDSARLDAQIAAGDIAAGSEYRLGRDGGPRPKEILETLAARLRRARN